MITLLTLSMVFFNYSRAGEISCPTAAIEAPTTKETNPFPHGLLHKITSRTGQESYIFGTMHVGDKRVLDISPSVISALEHSQQFVMEVVMDAKAASNFARQMYYADGKQLGNHIEPPLFSIAQDLLKRYGITSDQYSVMKPWAVFMMLNVPLKAPGPALDLVLMQKAKEKNITILGLETIDEQAQVLANLSLVEQVELVRDSVCNYETYQNITLPWMVEQYLAKDLHSLYTLSNQYPTADRQRYQHLNDLLIHQRNHKMAERLTPILRRGQAFIAVGALHLTGKLGLLNLLQLRGYQVSTVDRVHHRTNETILRVVK